MDKQTRRLWQSWEDYMREWVRRAEFRDALRERPAEFLAPSRRRRLRQTVREQQDAVSRPLAKSGHGRRRPHWTIRFGAIQGARKRLGLERR
jgi:hypothetical protein